MSNRLERYRQQIDEGHPTGVGQDTQNFRRAPSKDKRQAYEATADGRWGSSNGSHRKFR